MATLTEKDFLLTLAIKAYNEQFGKNLSIADFNYKFIENNGYSKVAYEAFPVNSGNLLRLRVYCAIGREDTVGLYKLAVDGTEFDNALGDEVFVANGTIDSYYLENKVYRFNTQSGSVDNSDNAITSENGDIIVAENGDIIIPEAA